MPDFIWSLSCTTVKYQVVHLFECAYSEFKISDLWSSEITTRFDANRVVGVHFPG